MGRGIFPSLFFSMIPLKIFLFFAVFLFFPPIISCGENPPSAETVFDMPLYPGAEFFKEIKKGQIKIYKTRLSQEEVVNFYKGHYKEKDASFFKKGDIHVIMVAGNQTRVIEVVSKDKETLISFSKFDL